MKLDAAGWAYTASGSAMMSAAGAMAQLGEDPISIALMGVAGVCAIIGALYYRSSNNESALRDIAISIAMAFLIGAAGGGVAGAWLETHVFAFSGFHLTLIGQHMLGGAALGAVLAPLTRAVLSGKIGGIFTAAKAFIETLTGGGK